MFTPKLKLIAPLIVLVVAASINLLSLVQVLLFRLLSLVLAYPLWQFWPVDTGSFAKFASAVKERHYGAMVAHPETIGELGMFTTKLNLVAPLAFAVLGVIAASTESALAGSVVPAPSLALAYLLWRFWPADTGSFARSGAPLVQPTSQAT